jgi:Cu/Ag efflux protein CusF
MSSPRSAQVSVLKFLSIVKPELRNMDSDSPEVIAAQKELAKLQSKAKKIILMQADVNQVVWRIDKSWFASYGVYLD